MKDQKRILNLTIVVLGAIFMGVVLTVLFGVQQANNPAIRHLMAQQSQILNLQKEFGRQLGGEVGLVSGQGTVLPSVTQQALERRVLALEKKVEKLVASLGNLGAPPQAAQRRPGPPSDEYAKVHKINVAHSPVRGNKKAPVTIVEFVDFQCPFCSRFHPMIDKVLAAYPKKVNYVLKNFPLSFHPQAKPAAKAAFAAGEQGKYWEMTDLLLNNNTQLGKEKFEEWAKDIGLNVKKFKKDYEKKDAAWEKLIKADMTLGQEVQVRGTPTFYINGRKTQARDLSTFKKEIDAILKKK